jgi:transcriptional regulator with XRE-family HTH domain
MTDTQARIHRDSGDPAPAEREVPSDTPPAPALELAIAAQVRALRRASGLSVGDMAARAGISKAMLSKIENAQTSCSLTTLAKLAAMLDVPVTALFRGADTGREAVFTEAARGSVIVGRGTRVGHHYELLGALRGQHKRLEPVLVTLTNKSEPFPLFQHPGTELLYMLEGVMVYGHGDSEYTRYPAPRRRGATRSARLGAAADPIPRGHRISRLPRLTRRLPTAGGYPGLTGAQHDGHIRCVSYSLLLIHELKHEAKAGSDRGSAIPGGRRWPRGPCHRVVAGRSW